MPQRPDRDLAALLAEYTAGKVSDIDALVSAAEARAREIPDAPEQARMVRALAGWVAELEIRVRALEQGQEERDREHRRTRRRSA
jgi:hypothetical protein